VTSWFACHDAKPVISPRESTGHSRFLFVSSNIRGVIYGFYRYSGLHSYAFQLFKPYFFLLSQSDPVAELRSHVPLNKSEHGREYYVIGCYWKTQLGLIYNHWRVREDASLGAGANLVNIHGWWSCQISKVCHDLCRHTELCQQCVITRLCADFHIYYGSRRISQSIRSRTR